MPASSKHMARTRTPVCHPRGLNSIKVTHGRPSLTHRFVHLVEVAVHGGRGLIPVPPHRPLRQHHAHAHAALGRGLRLPRPPPPPAGVGRGAPLPGPPVPRQPADSPAAARARAGDGRLGAAARQRAGVAAAAPAAAPAAAAALEAVVALGALVVAAAGRSGGPLGVFVVGVVLEVLFVRVLRGVLCFD